MNSFKPLVTSFVFTIFSVFPLLGQSEVQPKKFMVFQGQGLQIYADFEQSELEANPPISIKIDYLVNGTPDTRIYPNKNYFKDLIHLVKSELHISDKVKYIKIRNIVKLESGDFILLSDPMISEEGKMPLSPKSKLFRSKISIPGYDCFPCFDHCYSTPEESINKSIYFDIQSPLPKPEQHLLYSENDFEIRSGTEDGITKLGDNDPTSFNGRQYKFDWDTIRFIGHIDYILKGDSLTSIPLDEEYVLKMKRILSENIHIWGKVESVNIRNFIRLNNNQEEVYLSRVMARVKSSSSYEGITGFQKIPAGNSYLNFYYSTSDVFAINELGKQQESIRNQNKTKSDEDRLAQEAIQRLNELHKGYSKFAITDTEFGFIVDIRATYADRTKMLEVKGEGKLLKIEPIIKNKTFFFQPFQSYKPPASISKEGILITFDENKLIERCSKNIFETNIVYDYDDYIVPGSNGSGERRFGVCQLAYAKKLYLVEMKPKEEPLFDGLKSSRFWVLGELQEINDLEEEALSNKCLDATKMSVHLPLHIKSEQEMAQLTKKYVENGVDLGTLLQPNIPRDYYNVRRDHIIGIRFRNNLLKAAISALNLIQYKAQFDRELSTVRDLYWYHDKKGAIPEEIRNLYAELLYLKDMELMSYQLADHMTYVLTGVQSNRVQEILQLFGELDNGIHGQARKAFSAWTKNIFDKINTSAQRGAFSQIDFKTILDFENELYVEYVRVRDIIEAYKMNNYSYEKYEGLYEAEILGKN